LIRAIEVYQGVFCDLNEGCGARGVLGRKLLCDVSPNIFWRLRALKLTMFIMRSTQKRTLKTTTPTKPKALLRE
jgi:hypothetical protein